MEKDEYLSKLKDYKLWFDYSEKQLLVAECILNDSLLSKERLLKIKGEGASPDDFVSLWTNSLYHYGVSIEIGLKALIIKYKPDELEANENPNGIQLKRIGKGGKTHSLLALASDAGIFKSIVLKNFQKKELEEVLDFLSDIIKWGARYPIPSNSQTMYMFNNKVHWKLVSSFHILDVIEPIFELFRKEKM